MSEILEIPYSSESYHVLINGVVSYFNTANFTSEVFILRSAWPALIKNIDYDERPSFVPVGQNEVG